MAKNGSLLFSKKVLQGEFPESLDSLLVQTEDDLTNGTLKKF